MFSASATTWQKQLEVLESRAADHDKLSAQLIAHLAEPLKALASRSEDLRKAHTDFAIKLDKERESTFGDLRKVKGKYDAACQEMESRRKKADGTFDFAKQKAQHNYAQQMNDMNNLKVCLSHLGSVTRNFCSQSIECLSHQHQRYEPTKGTSLSYLRSRTP